MDRCGRCREAKGVNSYNDIAPRMGMAYDVFGNGKTAIKVNLSKYWQYAANDGVYIGTNPASTFAQTANRAWTDANRNFKPDCDLQNPLGQDNRATGGDFCGALDNQNFFRFKQDGSVASTATRIDPALLSGWGVRPYDWQFAASVQQELMPRVAMDIGYSRRWWGNFTVTDNLAVGPADFDTYTRTSPSHARSAGRRAAVVLPAQKPQDAVRRGGQLPDAGQQLRRHDVLLAGRRHDGDRAHEQRPDAAGRLHDRRGHAGSVRHLGGAAGDS